MAQSVGDLIVNLDLNSPKFNEQLAYSGKKLSELGKAATAAADQADVAFNRQEVAARRAGMSVGAYGNAVRMLPAQFTDIATQLAGGQSPFLILLQQGGQVKDSFGGFAPMFQALRDALFGFSGDVNKTTDEAAESTGELAESFNNASDAAENLGRARGFITPFNVALAAAAVTAGLMMYSWYRSNSQLSTFNKTLVLSGNVAGLTAQKMLAVSKAAASAGITFSAAAGTLTALVDAGVAAGASFERLSVSITEFADKSGLKIEDVAKAFGRLTSDPTSGLIAMAQQFHNVTAAQIEHVSQLQRSGDAAGALKAANDAAAEGLEKQTRAIEGNMGTLERAANATGDAFKSMWDKILDIGRPDTATETLKKVQEQFDIAQANFDKNATGSGVSDSMRNQYQRVLDRTRVSLQAAQLQADLQVVAEKGAESQATIERDRLRYATQAQAGYEKSLSALDKYSSKQKELNKALQEGRILQGSYNTLMAVAKKEYEDSLKKPAKTVTPGGIKATDTISAQTLELQAQLEVLRQHSGLNDTISQQRKDLWKEQARFSVLEDAAKARALTADEKSLLSSKDQILAQAEINARLGDQIAIQERLNDLQDRSQKYVTQMGEKTQALTDSAGMSSRQTQRRLEEAQLLQGWKNAGGEESDKGYQRQLEASRKYYAAQDELRGNWQAGALTSMANFADDASSYNLVAANATSSLLNETTNSMATAFVDIINQTQSVGDAFKNMFASMGQAVIQTLAQMAAQWLVYQAVQLMVGKSTQASAAGAMINNATASALMAQLNAYASTAAIPILGPAAAPAAMAAAATATAPLVAAISMASLAGMAHDGLDKVPATGTWLLQKGERVVTANTSAKLDATLSVIQQQRENNAMQGQFNYSPTIQVNGDPDTRTIAMMEAAVKRGATQGFDMVVNSLSKGQGKVHDAVNVMYAKRKAR
ncbi:MAG: phage tail length tape measure family protein [Leclercia sp.]